jgi:hypothetical protein
VVVHPFGVVGVIAPGNLADPIARVAGALGHRLGRLPARKQPEDLTSTALAGLTSVAIVLFQLLGRHMGSKMYSSHSSCYNRTPGVGITCHGSAGRRSAYRAQTRLKAVLLFDALCSSRTRSPPSVFVRLEHGRRRQMRTLWIASAILLNHMAQRVNSLAPRGDQPQTTVVEPSMRHSAHSDVFPIEGCIPSCCHTNMGLARG